MISENGELVLAIHFQSEHFIRRRHRMVYYFEAPTIAACTNVPECIICYVLFASFACERLPEVQCSAMTLHLVH